ncbi:hypothetical protein H105_02746 [Trichophyton soudanense CBS 452.61]|uniref:Uncharacterized protein n=1 Tax=Trichophyton soudanense CBS 452.61 TaxID=1215331 RepID=A0A022XYM4_TRISD|nr:hypothetical protein H105_02746 [Trichophyton soudanense CBS 452.61]
MASGGGRRGGIHEFAEFMGYIILISTEYYLDISNGYGPAFNYSKHEEGGKSNGAHEEKRKKERSGKRETCKCLILCFLPETASSLPRANYASQSTPARTNWLNSVFGLWGRGKDGPAGRFVMLPKPPGATPLSSPESGRDRDRLAYTYEHAYIQVYSLWTYIQDITQQQRSCMRRLELPTVSSGSGPCPCPVLDGGWPPDVNLAHTVILLYISIYILTHGRVYRCQETRQKRRGSEAVRQAGRQAGRQREDPGSSSWPCRPVQLREFNSMLASRARIDVYHRHLAYSREGCEKEDKLADRAGSAGQISERNPKAL